MHEDTDCPLMDLKLNSMNRFRKYELVGNYFRFYFIRDSYGDSSCDRCNW